MSKRTRITIIAALAIVFVGAILIREGQRRAGVPSPKATGREVAGEASGRTPDGQPASTSPLPRLVDLGSTTCVPCKMMAPILEELSREYQGQFAVEVIDVRTNRIAAELYSIRVIPTQIFIDAGGQERFRHEGFMARDAILSKWAELGVSLRPSASAPAGQPG